jgi:DNA integrity scanning protein DisA with diadenylate cyclase activity
MSDISFDELVTLAENLPALEKVRLVERIMATLESDISEKQKTSKRSLLGLWEDLNNSVSSDDIDEARREMWGNFPREDI